MLINVMGSDLQRLASSMSIGSGRDFDVVSQSGDDYCDRRKVIFLGDGVESECVCLLWSTEV
jgi:hypothetical protein